MRFTLPIGAAAYRWHHWYAWHPVKLKGEYVWLERIERKREPGGWGGSWFEYRDIGVGCCR